MVEVKEMTEEVLIQVIPKKARSLVNKELVDELNTYMTNPLLGEHYRDNILGYMSVMKDGKFKLKEYFNAVRYCTFRLSGDSQIVAYTKTFPERINNYSSRNASQKEIASTITVYNKSKLVTGIMAQSMIPIHISNQDLHQQAINHLAHLMLNANSEKVQSDSAAKLVDALKPPDESKIAIDIGIKDDRAIEDLKATVRQLTLVQRERIIEGTHTAEDIAHSSIIKTSEVLV